MLRLEPADREAIDHLRTLLRGDLPLSAEEEEHAIATVLARRGNAVEGAPVAARTALVPGASYGLPATLWRPLGVQATVMGLAAGTSLVLVPAVGTFQNGYYEHTHNALVVLGVALILAAPALYGLLDRRFGRSASIVSAVSAASVAGVGAVALEYAALNWPTNSPPQAVANFVVCNAIVLVVALLIGALFAIRAHRRAALVRSHTRRRIGERHIGRLPGYASE